MAENWYPIIDNAICTECGVCMDFCSHGVYHLFRPVVIHPQGCVDHCHDCGNNCPVGAITYHGEDTGWIPPKTEHTEKSLVIEYLYLDLTTCDRCMGAEAVLDEVVAVLKPALELAGFCVDYKKQENIKSSAAAYINSFSIKNKIRYDIVEVILSDNNDLVSINHIEDAF